MFFVIGLGLILAAILGFGLFTRNWPKFVDCVFWQKIVIFFLAMLLTVGGGCLMYSLVKSLGILLVDAVKYLWINVP